MRKYHGKSHKKGQHKDGRLKWESFFENIPNLEQRWRSVFFYERRRSNAQHSVPFQFYFAQGRLNCKQSKLWHKFFEMKIKFLRVRYIVDGVERIVPTKNVKHFVERKWEKTVFKVLRESANGKSSMYYPARILKIAGKIKLIFLNIHYICKKVLRALLIPIKVIFYMENEYIFSRICEIRKNVRMQNCLL